MGSASHFWSLCVEEQFYLVWPFLVLFVPTRWLGRVMVGFGGGLACAAMCVSNELIARTLVGFPILAIGGLLAVLIEGAGNVPGRPKALRFFFFVAGILLFVGRIGALTDVGIGNSSYVIFGLGEGMLFAWVIGWVACGGSSFGWLLNGRVTQYFGKISYGLYVYHLFMPGVVLWILRLMRLDAVVPAGGRVVLYVLMTVLCSILSWHLYEKPFCDLKERFA